MTTSHLSKPARPSLLKRLTASAAAMTLLFMAGTPATSALASDLDFSSAGGGQSDGTHFLRVGLYKSAVIRLPGSVKDVIVGDPAVLDVVIRNKNTAYLFGRSAAQTNVFFFDANGNQILAMDIDVTLDTKALQRLIDRTIPGNQIKVDTAGANVVLKGVAQTATEAALAESLAAKMAPGENTVVNAMTIAQGDQVMLKVKVVEVKRDVLKTFGINLDTAFSANNITGALVTSNPILASAVTAGLGYTGDNFSIDATIEALESQELIKTLAEPNLTAVTGQRAQFLAGGQYPYISGISCDSNNTNCVNTVTYKDYGVKLGFTPTVLSEGRISLKIATEVSELDDVTTGALKTRAAETTIELPSGGAMMLAGLIKEDQSSNITGTPGLMDLPILGTLFRSRNFTSGQTELAVIVVPYIVNPVAEKQLASPDDRLAPPSDGGQIFWGKLNRMYGTAGNHPNGVYHGSVGYIIE
jgi:pilus assembly protein CpaC